jgi:two-component system chemotaxis response regulator CheB
MTPLRILVVDDSMVVRRIVCDTLAEDPALAIVGSASDGRAALAKLPRPSLRSG